MITIYISIKGTQMKQFIDFYMVVISPWCYLGLNRLISISKTYDIEINIKPIDIFFIFKEYGTKGVKDRPIPVQKNRINEIKRWGNYLDIKINAKPKFHPVDPNISSAANELERAFLAYESIHLDKPKKFFSSEALITGTIRLLSGKATAIPILIFA